MARILIILFCISLICCSAANIKLDNLENIHFLKEKYQSSDIQMMSKILVFFDNYIKMKTKVGTIDSAYHDFCEDLKYMSPSDIRENLYSLNSMKFLQSKFNHEAFFDEIWRSISYVDYERGTTKYELNHNGRIMILLKHLNRKYPPFHRYYKIVKETGGITPTLIGGYHSNHQNLNFNDPLVRLWTAIHFITIELESNHSQSRNLNWR